MGSITVNNLGKAYKQYPTRWARLFEWLDPRCKPRHDLNWVLQDINFTVQPGEAVGIIGINGAGKSTLLKMITGTTQPTTGNVQISGRVAALLELGMGFHPDFTGRQNAFMAGQLLGYSIEEIADLMLEIEAFAEIGAYVDQPVRMYSSGMQMRLAFSVATAHRPDVLIVDEALSVGDAYFQHKSFDRIREFRKRGTTLLLVSHDKQAIQSICDRAILLNSGRVAMQGEPEAVMDYYNALLADQHGLTVKQVEVNDRKMQTVSGTLEATLDEIEIVDDDGKACDVVFVGELVWLKIRIRVSSFIDRLVFGYMLKDRLGLPIFGTTSEDCGVVLSGLSSGSTVDVQVRFRANLGPGVYSFSTALAKGRSHVSGNFEWRDRVALLTVVNKMKGDFVGVAWLESMMTASVVEANSCLVSSGDG